ncbi:hypothetical protein ACSNOI_38890 [Actinomadura kijaniata]|uniref:hypothetical protein n=1 Tax=Actinomadura kijaniata TaxID=46161 RepID=UPI003F1AD9DE
MPVSAPPPSSPPPGRARDPRAHPDLRSQQARWQSQVARPLAARLGARTAGSYVDRATGRLVVTVTDADAARAVTAAGAEPRTVRRSRADLKKVELAERSPLPLRAPGPRCAAPLTAARRGPSPFRGPRHPAGRSCWRRPAM